MSSNWSALASSDSTDEGAMYSVNHIRSRVPQLWRRWRLHPLELSVAVALVALQTLLVAYSLVTLQYGVLQPHPFAQFGLYNAVEVQDPVSGIRRNYYTSSELASVQNNTALGSRLVASDLTRTTVSVDTSIEKADATRVNSDALRTLGVRLLVGTYPIHDRPSEPTAYISKRMAADLGVVPSAAALDKTVRVGSERFRLGGVFDDRYAWRGAAVIIPVAMDSSQAGRLFMTAVALDSPAGAAEVGASFSNALRAAGTTLSDSVRYSFRPLTEMFEPRAKKLFARLAAMAGLTVAACLCGLFGLAAARERRLFRTSWVERALGQPQPMAVIDRVLDYALVCVPGTALGLAASYALASSLKTLLPSGFLPRGADMYLVGWPVAFLILAAMCVTCATALLSAAVGATHAGARWSASTAFFQAAAGLQVAAAGATLFVAVTYARALWLMEGTSNASEYAQVFVMQGDGPMGDKISRRVLEVDASLANAGIEAHVAASLGLHPFGGPPGTVVFGDTTGGQRKNAIVLQVTERYGSAIGLRVLSGRGFEATDMEPTRLVAVLSESLARASGLSHSEALGASIEIPELRGVSSSLDPRFTVIGVVSDIPTLDCTERCAAAYIPATLLGYANALVIRPLRPSTVLDIQRAVPNGSSGADVVESVEARIVAETLNPLWLRTRLSLVFCCLGVFLGALNVFASADAAFRLKHRGLLVRAALGATRTNLLTKFLVPLVLPLAVASAAGVGVVRAWGSQFLPAIPMSNVETYSAVGLLLTVIVAFALIAPTRGVTRLNPGGLLRDDL
ncbi:ABC transporter permease [Luteitalea sp.]